MWTPSQKKQNKYHGYKNVYQMPKDQRMKDTKTPQDYPEPYLTWQVENKEKENKEE